MPQADDLAVPDHYNFQHVISVHMLTCTCGCILYLINAPISCYHNNGSISLFPDSRIVFPEYLALVFIVVHILHNTRETL